MKIGLVCPYDILKGGGVQEYVKEMYAELSRRGHSVKIITPTPPKYKSTLPEHILTIGGSRNIHRLFSTQAQLSATIDTELIDELLERENFDILHFHEPWIPVMSLQLLSRSKAINIGTFHAKIPDRFTSKTIVNALIPYGRTVVKYLDAYTAVSEPAAELIQTLMKKQVNIIPNGIDIEKFKKPSNFIQNSDNIKTIFYVGRLEKRKGLKFLLQAFKLLSENNLNIRLLIAGAGPEEESLRDYVSEYGISRVSFLGYLTEQQKIEHLHKCDLFCSPARYGESFGIVLLEAMAAGAPIVAGDNPGYESVLTGRGKLALVNPQDEVDFARRLEIMLFDKQIRELWLSWANKHVQQFSYANIIDEYEKLYRSVSKASE